MSEAKGCPVGPQQPAMELDHASPPAQLVPYSSANHNSKSSPSLVLPSEPKRAADGFLFELEQRGWLATEEDLLPQAWWADLDPSPTV